MSHIRLAAFMVLIIALPGCFKSAPLNDDDNHTTDSAEQITDEPTDTTVQPTDEQTDSTVQPTDEQTDSTVQPTDEQTDSTVKPTDDPTDSVELPTDWETSTADTATPRVPDLHRPDAEICDSERNVSEPGQVDAGAGCSSHADCMDGENGRCEMMWRDSGYICTYDACFTDDDCEAGMVCQCGGDGANYCLAEGNCRTDKECGANGYCSPTLGECGHYTSFVGYYCHTPEDECVDDADCSDDEYHYGGYCAYNKVSGSWMCSDSECVG